LTTLPDLPAIDAVSTARWIEAVLAGRAPLPQPLERQTQLLLHAYARMSATPDGAVARSDAGQPRLSG
jgi:anthranilate phosphoribosyltransferase